MLGQNEYLLLRNLAEKRKESVITCATYFSSKEDPQLKIGFDPDTRCRPADLTYLSTWLATSLFNDMVPLILLDEPNYKIIPELKGKGAYIIKCELGKMSTNDERFFFYKEITSLLTDNFIVFTDISDVIFKKGLDELLFKYPETLFFGADEPDKKLVKDSEWMLKKIDALKKANKKILKKKEFESLLNSSFVNAGTLGGRGKVLDEFLKDVVLFLKKCPNIGNWNMIAFNYATMKVSNNTKIGAPFVSEFKKYVYEFSGYIVHK